MTSRFPSIGPRGRREKSVRLAWVSREDHPVPHQMIDLVAEKFPDIARVIHYDEMVANPAAALRVAAKLCGLPISYGPLPTVDGDLGCALPYRQFMTAALES